MARKLTLIGALVALLAVNTVSAFGPYGMGYGGLYQFCHLFYSHLSRSIDKNLTF